MGFFSWLFGGWEKINELPRWVVNAHGKNQARIWKRGGHDYDKIFYYKGKTFVYKVIKTSEVQGGKFYFYRKKRNKI